MGFKWKSYCTDQNTKIIILNFLVISLGTYKCICRSIDGIWRNENLSSVICCLEVRINAFVVVFKKTVRKLIIGNIPNKKKKLHTLLLFHLFLSNTHLYTLIMFLIIKIPSKTLQVHVNIPNKNNVHNSLSQLFISDNFQIVLFDV